MLTFHNKNILLFTLCVQLFILSLPEITNADSTVTSKLNSLIKSRKVSLGISVEPIYGSSYSFNHGRDKLLKPASVTKLLTSVATLESKGANYSGNIDFLGNISSSGRVETMFVTGDGDPYFTTADLWGVARAFQRRGIKSIGTLVVSKALDVFKARGGSQPYQAAISGFSLNFNSLGISACSMPNKKVSVLPDIWEDSSVKISSKVGRTNRSRGGLGISERKGVYSVRGSVPAVVGSCVEQYSSVSDPLRSIFFSLKGFLGAVSIKGPSRAITRDVSGSNLIYRHKSKPLSQILYGMNNYSNNVMAEQLIYWNGIGTDAQSRYKTGLRRVKNFALSVSPRSGSRPVVVDGSGLSHSNRLTSRILVNILTKAYRSPDYGVEFISSLPVAGTSGTLKDWPWSTSQASTVRAKTGTLNGVRSLSGYILGKKVGLAFAILQNKAGNRSNSIRFERRFVESLSKIVL